MINLICMFSLWCIDCVESLYANRIFMYFCIESSIGTRVRLASCKSALNPTVVYSTDRSKAVVPVLVLLFVALCYFVLVCFSPFSIAILPRLGKKELNLVLFVRLFDLRLFCFVCFLFLLVSGKCCGSWLWHSLDFSLLPLFDCISLKSTT